MTLWNAACRTLVSFFQSDLTYSCKKNGNNKRIECLSNDSTVLISVLLCLCKGSILNITASFFILTSFYHCG